MLGSVLVVVGRENPAGEGDIRQIGRRLFDGIVDPPAEVGPLAHVPLVAEDVGRILVAGLDVRRTRGRRRDCDLGKGSERKGGDGKHNEQGFSQHGNLLSGASRRVFHPPSYSGISPALSITLRGD